MTPEREGRESASKAPYWCPALSHCSDNVSLLAFHFISFHFISFHFIFLFLFFLPSFLFFLSFKPESTAQVQGVVTLELVATLEEGVGEVWVRVPFWRRSEFWVGGQPALKFIPVL